MKFIIELEQSELTPALYQALMASESEVKPVEVKPVEVKPVETTYTRDQLKSAAMKLIASGRIQTSDLQELNAMYNTKSLNSLPEELFNNYAENLIHLGAEL